MIGWRFAAYGVVVGMVFAIMLGLYWKGRLDGTDKQHTRLAAAETRANAAALGASGERASAARVDVVVRQQSGSLGVARELAIEALKSEDADVPLAPDRVLRLRDADGKLCGLAAELVGCGTTN